MKKRSILTLFLAFMSCIIMGSDDECGCGDTDCIPEDLVSGGPVRDSTYGKCKVSGGGKDETIGGVSRNQCDSVCQRYSELTCEFQEESGNTSGTCTTGCGYGCPPLNCKTSSDVPYTNRKEFCCLDDWTPGSSLLINSLAVIGRQRFSRNLIWLHAAPPSTGLFCTQIYEHADPHSWDDNYLCANQELGLRWSEAGPVDGMDCTQVHEGCDPHTWTDNYLCAPSGSGYNFEWRDSSPAEGRTCILVNEPADPHCWGDNYLCYDP